MKLKIIAMMAALFFSANALAAIQITERQARNMDDVQSLGVIYINHNMATEHEAEQALSQMSDAQEAKYVQPILLHEPETNGPHRASEVIYRQRVPDSSPLLARGEARSAPKRN